MLRRSVWQHSRRTGLQPTVECDARPTELTIRCQLDGLALAFSVPGAYEGETCRVPPSALEDCEGSGQIRVSLESRDKYAVIARWEDTGVPREKIYDGSDAVPAFPEMPSGFTENDSSLVKALHEAMES